MMDKFLRLAGLARRSGRLAIGYDDASRMAKKGRECLMFTSKDISDKTLKEVLFLSKEYSAKAVAVPYTKLQVGHALGIKEVAVFAVSDKSFTKALRNAVAESDGGAV